MIHLDLDFRGTEILVSVLEGALSDLSFEISSTDTKDYRDMLKERRAVLQRVVETLSEARLSA